MTDVTYVGTVSTLEEKKGGWYAVHIAVPGKQYPVKADTKLEPLLKSVREIRDAGLVATCTVSETESRAVSTITGTREPSERSWSRTSKPPSPGSPMSSTTR